MTYINFRRANLVKLRKFSSEFIWTEEPKDLKVEGAWKISS